MDIHWSVLSLIPPSYLQLSPQQPDITSGDRPANTPIQQPDATSGDRAANTPLQQLDATPQLQYPSFQYETSLKPQKQPQQVPEKVVLAIASNVDVRLDKLNKLLIAIADFMNSNGGSLSISVDDLLASGGKEGSGFSNNQDLMRQNILARVSASIGAEFTSLVKVRFATVRGKKMAIVEVSKAPKPALLKRD